MKFSSARQHKKASSRDSVDENFASTGIWTRYNMDFMELVGVNHIDCFWTCLRLQTGSQKHLVTSSQTELPKDYQENHLNSSLKYEIPF